MLQGAEPGRTLGYQWMGQCSHRWDKHIGIVVALAIALYPHVAHIMMNQPSTRGGLRGGILVTRFEM